MDVTKIWTVLCAFLLLICLTLAITSLVVLRNAVAETDAWHSRATALTDELEACIAVFGEERDSYPTGAVPDTEVDVLYNRFCIRETGGKIGIYSDEGYLVRLLDTPVSTLPSEERRALEKGITVNSWEELFERIQSYQ